jgi:hypothetical protein
MTKRQFYARALLASLPVAAKLLPEAPRDLAAFELHQRVASFAARLAEELTLECETQMVLYDEMDEELANQSDPDYVPSTREIDGDRRKCN